MIPPSEAAPLKASFRAVAGFSSLVEGDPLLFLIQSKLKALKMSSGECHQTLCAAVCVGGVCGAVCIGLVMQDAGPRLMPPSAPVKAVAENTTSNKTAGCWGSFRAVLHVKLDKNIVFIFISMQMCHYLTKLPFLLEKERGYFRFCQNFSFPKNVQLLQFGWRKICLKFCQKQKNLSLHHICSHGRKT